jgi:hypothetical protein
LKVALKDVSTASRDFWTDAYTAQEGKDGVQNVSAPLKMDMSPSNTEDTARMTSTLLASATMRLSLVKILGHTERPANTATAVTSTVPNPISNAALRESCAAL